MTPLSLSSKPLLGFREASLLWLPSYATPHSRHPRFAAAASVSSPTFSLGGRCRVTSVGSGVKLCKFQLGHLPVT